jgi:hypothetical protein
VLVALDGVEGAATGVKVLRLNEGGVIVPGITQNSNGVVTAVVSDDVRSLISTR